MKQIRNIIILALSGLFFAGCSGTKQLGSVGGTTFYQVKARSFTGPNLTALVTSDEQCNVKIETVAGGNGIGHTLVGAAGNVGAAAAFGLSLRPDRTTVNTGSYSDSEANSAATGGAGAASSTGGNRVNGNSANAPGHNK